MLQPSYSDLMDKLNEISNAQNQINSRYSIVIAVSRRARQINEGAQILVDTDENKKSVSIAVDELYHGKIKITANYGK